MTIYQTIASKLERLPMERQLEVLDFVEFIERRRQSTGPRHDPEGLLANQVTDMTLQEVSDLRREAWSSFPRGDSK